MSSANGVKTGLFTSPHLIFLEERIRIDGRPIETDQFDDAIEKVRIASEEHPPCSPTFFETTFLAAMVAFRECGVQRAIIETGMGGRLDATILVEADLAILTTISMDHSEYLGQTIGEIASEKVAIHRQGSPLIALKPKDMDVQRIISEKAGEDLVWVTLEKEQTKWDAYSAITSIVAENLGWPVTEHGCVWPGRSPNFGASWIEGIDLKFSAAHNPESIANDIEETKEVEVILFAMIDKKEIEDSIKSLAEAIRVKKTKPKIIFTEIRNGRKPSARANSLREMLHSHYPGIISSRCIVDSREAFLDGVMTARHGHGNLLVMGSIYLIGEIMSEIISSRGLDAIDIMTIH
tara:strand:+ start:2524 stop:3573 length:1050 start_codon:yes stop_codon:yes gene_type:complete